MREKKTAKEKKLKAPKKAKVPKEVPVEIQRVYVSGDLFTRTGCRRRCCAISRTHPMS